jgi:ELWxxDGT repeat protein
MKKITSLATALLLAVSVFSQAPFLFKSYDLNPGTGFSSPAGFINFAGKFYFTASLPATGWELWVGDATGCSMLKELRPGTNSSSPQNYCISGGKLFFTADDNGNARRLWVSDGTAVGTKMINAAVYLTAPDNPLFACNGKILFGGNTSADGTELWISDGTDTGTKLVMDIRTGTGSSEPANFTEFNGKVYFSANDNIHGNELWETDGTNPGTALVKDIEFGSASSSPARFCASGSYFYFSAYSWGNGIELWRSDGTANGTTMVKDIYPGAANGLPSVIIPYNGNIYFAAGDINGHELWTSDGSTNGTVMVKDLYPGGYSSDPVFFTLYNNKIYFQATDTAGTELWVTDGTTTGTQRVADINPGSAGSGLTRFIVYKNRLFFKAYATGTDYQLMQTDGTAQGTSMIAPSTAAKTAPLADTWEFFVYPGDSSIYFAANYDNIDFELWSLTDTTTYPPPPCEAPAAIHFTNVTMHGATISWDSVTGATEYEYHLGPFPSTPSTGTVTNDTTVLVAGLNPNITYEFCVRTICGEEESGWICDTFTTAATSVPRLSVSEALRVYPNPGTGTFIVDVPSEFGTCTATITNVYGQVVERREIANIADRTFDLRTVAKGIYTIQLNNRESIYRAKVVVQ